tara:strand:- start:104 stop:217 length:114 start_codon:yes stop_codon:yes gene_type:complete
VREEGLVDSGMETGKIDGEGCRQQMRIRERWWGGEDE